MNTVFLARLPNDINTREIENLLSPYGKVLRVNLKRGYAFVEFEDERSVETAVREANGREIGGFNIIVELARGKREIERTTDCFKCGRPGHMARDCPTLREGGRYDSRDSGYRRDPYSRDSSYQRRDTYDSRGYRPRERDPYYNRQPITGRSPMSSRDQPRRDYSPVRDRVADTRSRSPGRYVERSRSPIREQVRRNEYPRSRSLSPEKGAFPTVEKTHSPVYEGAEREDEMVVKTDVEMKD
eukprot:GHVP01068538.1.p1 GENE.GHVP01068538.1~~GHVP01068538.1.p1  ORF type:complete len:242 (-),score=45.71 GHVP01068538.1:658-1383(-)